MLRCRCDVGRGNVAVGVLALAVVGLVVTSPAAAQDEPRKVPRVWASQAPAAKRETESLAALRVASGVRLFATCKKRHVVEVFDAATGQFIQTLGRKGGNLGEFHQPNGVATIVLSDSGYAGHSGGSGGQDKAVPALLVVERDNRRVQVFHAETLAPLGAFGQAELQRPYGLTAAKIGAEVMVWVTDTRVPPEQRVRQYTLKLADGVLSGRHVRSFGERSGAGELRTPESIAADPANRRLYICDEDDDRGTLNVKVYDLEGRFTGQTLADGLIVGEPEGLVVVNRPGGPHGAGLVILTDQRKNLSVWHVFDRSTLKRLGSFTGEPTIANTDGICVMEEAFANFPGGAFFAVNDDDDIHAYRLEEVWPQQPATE